MVHVVPAITRYFNKWRLVLSIFLVVYAVVLLWDLGYMAIQWDETPHLYGGLLLSQGQIQDYARASSFYPPLFGVTTALFFKILGASVFSGRLAAVTFGVLSVWMVFELANRLYGSRNALISSIFLASMPSFIWLCRIALIETMLIFFFLVSLLLFFSWTRTNNDKMLFLSGVTLGLGFLVKYQIIISGLVMLVTLFLLWRKRISSKIVKFLLMLMIAAAIAGPWMFFVSQEHGSATLDQWLYALQVGNEERNLYSSRFPAPVFYLIEMTYPYMDIHPVSIFVYVFALLGLVLMLWRRRIEDKFALTWFFVACLIFTLIPNKQWRYMAPVLPVLAISASEFVLFIMDKAGIHNFTKHLSGLHKAHIAKKIVTVLFVLLVSASIIYSSFDAYSWIQKDRIHVPVDEACRYVADRSTSSETVIVLCASNLFNSEIVKFHFQTYCSNERSLRQYPELPVDSYKVSFNATELIERCEALHARYLLLYEYGSNEPFFQPELTSQRVIETLCNTERFNVETECGYSPNRIFILSFS